MKTATKSKRASASGVRQNRAPASPAKSARTHKISARLSHEVFVKKPSNESWGDFFTRLAKRAEGFHKKETARGICWCCLLLDRLVAIGEAGFPDDPTQPYVWQCDRLEKLAGLNEQIASLRVILEGVIYANR